MLEEYFEVGNSAFEQQVFPFLLVSVVDGYAVGCRPRPPPPPQVDVMCGSAVHASTVVRGRSCCDLGACCASLIESGTRVFLMQANRG